MGRRAVTAMVLAGLFGSAHAAESIETLANTCNNCHGIGGVSVGPSMPSIGGLPESYLTNVMLEWKSGTRFSATMGRLLKGYSDVQIADLAAYFSRKPWVPQAQKTDDARVRLGAQSLKRCAVCHGDDGVARDAVTPHLNGQWAGYLHLEALKYRDDATAMPNQQMRRALQRLSDEELRAVSDYYASQK
ncbi:MAG: c-type cytochrome [Gammaproteobacteria bacterium]